VDRKYPKQTNEMKNMKIKIKEGIELTTEHPASSYGIPVLILNGKPYGPCDDALVKMPDGQLRISTLGEWLVEGLNRLDKIPDGVREAVDSWLSQWPHKKSRPKLNPNKN
jgi:hypothetical protein